MRILFAGTSAIGEAALRAIITHHELIGLLTQPDRPVGRHQEMMAPAMKQLVEKLAPQIPIFQPERLRDPSVLQTLEALKPDVIVTMAYGKIVPPALLELPRLACLNIHASLLPRHRGASPIQHAIIEGDVESGITIMYMAEGLDTGDILLTKKLILDSKETAATLTDRLAALAPKALLEALELVEQNKAPRIPQSEKEVTHTHRIERKHALLSWTESACTLERLIRGLNPKPGAHGVIRLPSGKEVALKVFSAKVIPHEYKQRLTPGDLFPSQEQGFLVSCGKEALQLEEIQPEGRARMSFTAFARGAQLC